eukprot:Clim_evm4s76 gene=Clim_evmTU4s76
MYTLAVLIAVATCSSSVTAAPTSVMADPSLGVQSHVGTAEECNTTYLNLTNNMPENLNFTLYRPETEEKYFSPGTFDENGSLIIPSNSTALLCRTDICIPNGEVYITVDSPFWYDYSLFGAVMYPENGEDDPQDCVMMIHGYKAARGTAFSWTQFIDKTGSVLGHANVSFCTPRAYELGKCDQPLRSEDQ